MIDHLEGWVPGMASADFRSQRLPAYHHLQPLAIRHLAVNRIDAISEAKHFVAPPLSGLGTIDIIIHYHESGQARTSSPCI